MGPARHRLFLLPLSSSSVQGPEMDSAGAAARAHALEGQGRLRDGVARPCTGWRSARAARVLWKGGTAHVAGQPKGRAPPELAAGACCGQSPALVRPAEGTAPLWHHARWEAAIAVMESHPLKALVWF